MTPTTSAPVSESAPAPQGDGAVSEGAVEAAVTAYGKLARESGFVCAPTHTSWPRKWMRAALEAALPHLRPAPVALPSEEEIARAIHEGLGESWAYSNYSGNEWEHCRPMLDSAARAVLSLLSRQPAPAADGRADGEVKPTRADTLIAGAGDLAISLFRDILGQPTEKVFAPCETILDASETINVLLARLQAETAAREATVRERDEAQREAVTLAKTLHRLFYSDVTQWRPCENPAAVISQIDNMVAGIMRKLEAAESALTEANAKIERLKDALREALSTPGWVRGREAAGKLLDHLAGPTDEAVRDPEGRATGEVRPAQDEVVAALLSASPDDYWSEITSEVEASGRDFRHAYLLNHQAAHLLAWANIARSSALSRTAKPETPQVNRAGVLGLGEAMKIAADGFRAWAEKPHNARWARKIDGTPIPNDLPINIAEAFVRALAQATGEGR